MGIEFDGPQTLFLAGCLLFVGRFLTGRVKFLWKYNIPVPVIGGLVFAVITTTLHFQFDTNLSFDMAMKTPLLLAFFTTVGLGADFRMLAKGGMPLLLFLGLATVFIVAQNALSVLMALAMDLHPLVGMLSGSITMTGGHGTGAAYAETFGAVQNIHGAMELAMACATFGLVIGGLIGGPLAEHLITRNNLSPTAIANEVRVDASADAETDQQITASTFMETLFILLICLVGGALLSSYVEGSGFTLPTFIWCLFIGIAIRNLLELSGFHRIHQASLQLIGTVSLSLFLAMALMSLRLWELVDLAGPISALLAVQTVAMVLFAYFITFRLMGRNYDAAIMAGGHCGFGLGATPTAVANMEALVSRYGPSPRAFLIIPIAGAFFIDITNAFVIQGYLATPVFGF